MKRNREHDSLVAGVRPVANGLVTAARSAASESPIVNSSRLFWFLLNCCFRSLRVGASAASLMHGQWRSAHQRRFGRGPSSRAHEMPLAPDSYGVDQWPQSVGVFREFVPHGRRNLAGSFASHESLLFQLSQLPDEHFVRYRRGAPLHLPELVGLTREPVENRELPLATDGEKRSVQGTVCQRIRRRRARAVTCRCVLVHGPPGVHSVSS